MFKLAMRSITQHKARLSMTVISIALGVAFVAGTFVFTDSIQARFDTLFTDVYAGVDATVRPEQADLGTSNSALAASLADEIAALDGVQTGRRWSRRVRSAHQRRRHANRRPGSPPTSACRGPRNRPSTHS